ncbi:10243_t:CDS:2, partial [Diversispora eburnea]
SLLLESSFDPQYLQMYTWDTNEEINYRLNITLNTDINSRIIQSSKEILYISNPYRINNTPTALQVAIIWINEDISLD